LTADLPPRIHQHLNLAGLFRQRIERARQAVEAKATSDAEQIIACGGTIQLIEVDGEQVETVVPNDTCEDQFSDEYLEWLWITTLPDVDANVTILDPRLTEQGEVLLTVPTGGAASGQP